MFVHLSVHYPRPGRDQDLVESMLASGRTPTRTIRRPTRPSRPTAIRWAASAGRRRSRPAVAFMASDEASFVDGVSLLVDGGYCA